MKSTFLKLHLNDFLRGLLVAVISPVFTIAIDSVSQGNFDINWKHIGMVALSAAGAYLSKNLFTDSNKQAVETLSVAATEAGTEIVIAPKPTPSGLVTNAPNDNTATSTSITAKPNP